MKINRLKISLLSLSLLCAFSNVEAQRTTSLKINEVLVINETNYQDDYGVQHPWIEIYNSSAGTVNIAGCFLTTDLNQPRMYPIPKGDVLTKVKPHQHMLFWADGQPSRGTFHLSFTLDSIGSNFIALFDSDGKTLIDSVTVPAGQVADISYGLVHDGWDAKRLDEELRLNQSYEGGNKLWIPFTQVTPSSNNFILDKNDKVENFSKNDSIGIGMTLTAMSVVFFGLLALYLSFKVVGKIAISLSHRRVMKTSGVSIKEAKDMHEQSSGEVFAAIAMALYEDSQHPHDEESTVLTIKNTARDYSPWSSKIYMLRETPTKK
ncbi:hypothetical protein AGMMS49525_14250 [Bacteroidia bacterium]|nr:hypothetical protein AGMMS49525_14250 [Bacteroidia bacterium]